MHFKLITVVCQVRSSKVLKVLKSIIGALLGIVSLAFVIEQIASGHRQRRRVGGTKSETFDANCIFNQ